MIILNQEIVEFDVAIDCDTIENVLDTNKLYSYMAQKHEDLLFNRTEIFKLISMHQMNPNLKIILVKDEFDFNDYISCITDTANYKDLTIDKERSDKLSALLSMRILTVSNLLFAFPTFTDTSKLCYIESEMALIMEDKLSTIELSKWSAMDVYRIMLELGIDPTPSNIDIFMSHENITGFDEVMGTYGNELLTQMITHTFKLDK